MAYMFFPYNPIQIYMYTYMYVPVFLDCIYIVLRLFVGPKQVSIFFWGEAVRVFHRRHGFGRSKKNNVTYTLRKNPLVISCIVMEKNKYV